MGCWNKTCGLSKLHIYAGDEVLVFTLQESTDGRGNRCYSTALFSPILLPFYSKYDDYGGGEESHGIGFDLLMTALQDKLVEMPVGENQYHDIAVKREKFGEKEYFESIHEGRLKVSRRVFGGESAIEFVMFRKDIVDDILANYVIEHYVGDGKGTCGWENNYINYTFADVVADIPAFIDEMERKMAQPTALDDRLGADKEIPPSLRFALTIHSLENVFEWRHPNKASWYISNDSHRYSRIIDIADAIVEVVCAGDRAKATELLHDHLLAQFLDRVMHDVRAIWTPGCHEGSQSTEPDGYRALTAAINRALDEETKRFSEDDEE